MNPLERRTVRRIAVVLALAALTVAGLPAIAQAASPAWQLSLNSYPTNLPPGDAGTERYPEFVLLANNVGAVPSTGPVTLTLELPAGITPSAAGPGPSLADQRHSTGTGSCSVAGQTVTCVDPNPVGPGAWIVMDVPVDVDFLPDPTELAVSGAISGGGGASVSEQITTTVSDAVAPFGFRPGRLGLNAAANDADGAPMTQAGSHPYRLNVNFTLPTQHPAPPGNIPFPAGTLHDVRVDLPAGMVVNPAAAVQCTSPQLIAGSCPDSSQVGTASIPLPIVGVAPASRGLYNMVPPPGAPAAFGFVVNGVPVLIVGGVRPDDYRLTSVSSDAISIVVVSAARIQLWGSPTDPGHDGIRGACGGTGNPENIPTSCPVTRSDVPLLTMPTSCNDSLLLTAAVDFWEDLASFDERDTPFTDANGNVTGTTGCGEVPFTPLIDLQPTSRGADASSGMDVRLSIPQDGLLDRDRLAQAHLRDTVVRLPAGMSLNPGAADGLAACSEAQIGLVSDSPIRFNGADPACPDGSNVGTAEVNTPVLDEPLTGNLYVADPNDNPFDTLLSGYLVVRGQGVMVKLAGRFDPDPVTGQITATFNNNPQLPFEDFTLHFKGGNRGVISTPSRCGTYQIDSAMTSWASSVPFESVAPFSIDSNCAAAGTFDPSFRAGTETPVAGTSSPFTMTLSREPATDHFRSVSVVLPPGLLASIKGIPQCPEAQANAGTCSEASKVGRVVSSAGSGSTPLWIPQAGKAPTAVYLAGPYKGAPLSLSVLVPAQAGPFDLGNVVVRVALHIDPTDGHATAIGDPLPSILKGILLNVRTIRLAMDRPGFTLNPTSCAEKTIAATIGSQEGRSKDVSARFQVGDCAGLQFKPRLRMRLTGRRQIRTGRHPGVRAQVNQTGLGEAGIKRAEVRLPKQLALDPDNARALCEFEDGTKVDLENHCPKGSIVGRARAVTPLLNDPLAGNVYFVKNIRTDPRTGNRIRTLPMIVAALRGEVAINLKGESNVKRGRLVNTFNGVPDAPITQFNLNVKGGKTGILVVTGSERGNINICATKRMVAQADMDGQNGKRHDRNIRVKTPCTKKQKRAIAKRKQRAAKRRAAARRR